MYRTIQDIATDEFEGEIDNIASKLKSFSVQAFDAMRLMRISEKVFALKTVTLELKNGSAKLPDDFYKEAEGFLCSNAQPLEQINNLGSCDTYFSFDIRTCLLKSNHKIGTIQLSYYAIPTDENGLPLITEENGIDIAIKKYLRYQQIQTRYYIGEVGIERLQIAQQDWLKVMADVRGAAKMPTPAGYRRIIRTYNGY